MGYGFGKGAFFESFVPDGKAVLVPKEEFDVVALSVEKEEEGS